MSSKKNKKLGVAPNLQSAGEKLHFTKEFLRDAKNAGCDGFALRGSVDCDKVAAWLARHPEFVSKWKGQGGVPPRAVSQAVAAHFDALERKRRYEERISKLIPLSVIAQRLQALSTKQKAIAEQHIKDPVALASFCEAMQAMVNEWQQQKVNL